MGANSRTWCGKRQKMAYQQEYGFKELRKGCVELNSPKRNKGNQGVHDDNRGVEN